MISEIYVTGDAGEDLFTYPRERSHSERPAENEQSDNEIVDWKAPSGAPFMHHVFGLLLGDIGKIELLSGCRDKDATKHNMAPLFRILTHLGIPVNEKSSREQRVRIKEFNVLQKKDEDGQRPNLVKFPGKFSPDPQRLLVIHESCKGWSKQSEDDVGKTVEEEREGERRDLEQMQADLVQAFCPASATGLRILVNLKELPDVDEEEHEPHSGEDYPEFRSHFWRQLANVKPYVGIVVSLATLRRAGAVIRHGLSWEQTVEDFAAELHLFRKLRALSQFRHLFVRVEREGLIHLVNEDSKAGCRLVGSLYFVPYAKDDNLIGHVVGKNTMLIAALAARLRDGKELQAEIGKGIREGVMAAQLAHDRAYDVKFEEGTFRHFDDDRWPNGRRLIDTLFWNRDKGEHGEHLLASARKQLEKNPHEIVAVEIPEYVLVGPMPDGLQPAKRWYILSETIEQAPIHRINVAVAVVKKGLRSVLNNRWSPRDANKDRLWETLTRVESWNPRDRAPDFVTLQDGYGYLPAMPPRARQNMPVLKGKVGGGFHLFMPVAEYGKLVAVERDQIESLRSIGNLLRQYQDDEDRHDKPISIAVFAPPGAGKSFAVKQIAESVGLGKDALEYNIAQFHGAEDLSRAFHEIAEKGKKATPLVFFDEFDSARDQQELGWLKFFLAPMQDGAFYSPQLDRRTDIGRAVFIFAGGVYSSFERFDPRSTSADEQLGYVLSEPHKKQVEQFKQAKGPDFISRLRGYINIAEANAAPGRSKHFARRAIQLRGLLEQLKFTAGGWAKIDEEIIYALLTVDRYHHGIRSMEAVLRMCRPIDGWIRLSSLPAAAQLNMHVDAEEFFIRLHRGRSRAEDWIGPSVKKRINKLRSPAAADAGSITENLGKLIEKLKVELEAELPEEDPSKLDAKLEVLEELLSRETVAGDGAAGLERPRRPPDTEAPAEEVQGIAGG